MPLPGELRRRIEVQGFTGLTDDDLARLAPWLRFTPLMNALAIGAAILMQSVPMLLVLSGVMALGAVFPYHPFDRLYNALVRPLEQSPELPPSGTRRRIVFAGGSAWLFLLAELFRADHARVALLLGVLTTGMIALLAAAHICIASEILDRFFGTPGKRA